MRILYLLIDYLSNYQTICLFISLHVLIFCTTNFCSLSFILSLLIHVNLSLCKISDSNHLFPYFFFCFTVSLPVCFLVHLIVDMSICTPVTPTRGPTITLTVSTTVHPTTTRHTVTDNFPIPTQLFYLTLL